MTDWSLEQDTLNHMLMRGGYGLCNNKEGETDGSDSKVCVEHNYVDHYNDPINCPKEESSKRRGPRGGVLVPFPEKLYQMLDQIAEDGLDDVVSFQPHGRCFVVHQPDRFVKEVMPRYFSQTKLTSFQRQVNLYGFRRFTTGADRNGYYHELFLRGRPDLLKRMARVRVKGIGCKLAPSPGTEPNLYKFQTCHANKLDTMMREGRLSGGFPAAEDDKSFHNKSNGSMAGCYEKAQQASQLKESNMGHNRQGRSLYNQLCTVRAMPSLQNNVRDFESNPSLALPVSVQSFPASVQTFRASSQATASEVDLTPFPTSNSSTGYLLDIREDIINLLSDHSDPVTSFQPMAAHSNGNILNELVNFWEV